MGGWDFLCTQARFDGVWDSLPLFCLGLGAPKFIDLGVLDVTAQDVFL